MCPLADRLLNSCLESGLVARGVYQPCLAQSRGEIHLVVIDVLAPLALAGHDNRPASSDECVDDAAGARMADDNLGVSYCFFERFERHEVNDMAVRRARPRSATGLDHNRMG